jgi:voltage-gated potassium channel
MVFLLILLPFTFIEFFYLPWIKAQEAARTPRKVAAGMREHVIITSFDPGTRALVQRLRQHGWRYVLVIPEADEALRLKDDGYEVVVGKVDDPETYRRLRVDQAAMVVTTSTDVVNSHVALTVREVSSTVPIVCSADKGASVDLLELAGAHHVLRFEQLMGAAFARWTLGGKTEANIIGEMEGVLVAEASAFGTPLVGKTLKEIGLRAEIGVTVAGVWKRGHFEPSRFDTRVDANTVLVLVGSKEHLAAYDARYSQYGQHEASIVILGGGRVGQATARTLAQGHRDYRIVDKDPGRIEDDDRGVVGDAADLEVLKRAGIDQARTVIVTTHDDDVNVYLTVYCRKLRPDAQIIARATRERTIASLHRAGADFVLSYASMGASAMLNLLKQDKVLLVAEGLDFFRVPVPRSLAGTTIADCGIREQTGCSVVAVKRDGDMRVVPNPTERLPADGEMLMIGTVQSEQRFLETYRD